MMADRINESFKRYAFAALQYLACLLRVWYLTFVRVMPGRLPERRYVDKSLAAGSASDPDCVEVCVPVVDHLEVTCIKVTSQVPDKFPNRAILYQARPHLTNLLSVRSFRTLLPPSS